MFKEQNVAIKELKELFEIENNIKKGTSENNGKFYISKQQMERFDVLLKLKTYFRGVFVKDGYVSVGPLTFVHTTFEVRNGKP